MLCNYLLICFVKHNLVKIWTRRVNVTTGVKWVNVAMTRYPKKYLYLILTASDSLHIRYTLFVFVAEAIRIRIYPTLPVFESESDRKYESKYNISDICPYPIRLYPYLLVTAKGAHLVN